MNAGISRPQWACAPFRSTRFPSAQMRVERRVDGTLVITPELALAEYPHDLLRVLADRAVQHPDKAYLAERRQGPSSPWQFASYGEVNAGARAVAAWILAQHLPADRSLLILSGNSITHAIIKYGAMAARLPVCPVSVNYSLMSGDFGRLKHVIKLLRPAVVFAEHTAKFRNALERVDFGDAILVTDEPQLLGPFADRARSPRALSTAEVLATAAGDEVDRSIEAINADEPSIYMLTSGSTSLPKAVIQTQRMLCSNLVQGEQVLRDTAGSGHATLNWLPWSHVAGAVTKFGTLMSGGTLYIDGGRPLPGAFDETVRNLKEVAPRFYINVPIAYGMLVDALERDAELRERLFGNLQIALYGGAGLPQALYDRFQKLAVDTVGERIFFTTGYGLTETAAGCLSIYFHTEQVGIGLPCPGTLLKLVPNADRYEVRLKGPMVTAGYVGGEANNHGIFDEEGFFRTGDAAQFHDPDDIGKGLKFAGRLVEEFKLTSGTWVSAGRLRLELLEALSPLVADTLLCGENRDRLTVLAWPKVEVTPALRDELAVRLERFNTGRGASEYISALGLLTEPPNVDAHEVSDKGTINQRVAIARRSRDVERLYEDSADTWAIRPAGAR